MEDTKPEDDLLWHLRNIGERTDEMATASGALLSCLSDLPESALLDITAKIRPFTTAIREHSAACKAFVEAAQRIEQRYYAAELAVMN